MDLNFEKSESRYPTVSIILPVFNGASSLSRALASVAAQSLADYELIVIDDGSTDATPGILRQAAADPRIVFFRNDANRGLQFSLNRGLAQARGRYLARIDADDEWLGPDKLAEQVRFLDSHPDHVCVGTGAVVTDAAGRELFRFLKPQTDAQIRRTILGRCPFLHGSVVMRRQAAAQVGGYSQAAADRHVEDYDLWLKLGQVGQLANLPRYALKYALSAGQISSRHKLEQFRKNLDLARRYRRAYPGYWPAVVRGWARQLVYGHLNLGGLRRWTAGLTRNQDEL